VVLQLDGAFVRVRPIVGDRMGTVPAGTAFEFNVVLDQDAILEDGERGLSRDLAVLIEERAMIDDVITLPLTRLAAGVGERDGPAVQRGTLAVRIGLVVVGIEDLDLILSVQEHTAVAPALAGALHVRRRGELDVELTGAEVFRCRDVAGLLDRLHVAILADPLRGLPVLLHGFLRPVKQHDRVAGGSSAFGPRRDNRRGWAIRVVNEPTARLRLNILELLAFFGGLLGRTSGQKYTQTNNK